MKYNFICIEGNIGSGKSTLTQFLEEHLQLTSIYETFEDNDFLKSFYENPNFALHSELQFLLDRSLQFHKVFKKQNARLISDYSTLKSLIFAKANLSNSDFKLYEQIAFKLLGAFPKPDLIVYLNRSIQNLQANISQRGRTYEHQISNDYLEKIDQAYKKHLSKLYDCPVLFIDAKEINLNKEQELLNAFTWIFNQSFQPGEKKISISPFLNLIT